MENNMNPMKLAYNRVWRTYTGGAAIDTFYGKANPVDDYYPEVWIASTTSAVNPDYVENEGLSVVEGSNQFLLDIIKADPVAALGQKHIDTYGITTGVLVKLLDAAERLTIQVHPNKKQAMDLFKSQFGKTEAWYIMDGREINGQAPHIYFGFKEGIQKAEWIDLFKEQDTQGMLDCLNKIEVKAGDVYLIEGGTPHAIGAGCFILEVQEPTDLTIRIEKTTPGGYEIPDRICHQGLGFQRMFECFDFTGYSQEEIHNKWHIVDGGLKAGDSTVLIGQEHTSCFGLELYEVNEDKSLPNSEGYAVLIVLSGEGKLLYEGGSLTLNKGEQIFVPASTGPLSLVNTNLGEALKVIRCLPPVTK